MKNIVYWEYLKKTFLGSLFTFIPLLVSLLLKFDPDSKNFYYLIIFCSLAVSPFWIKFVMAQPENTPKNDIKYVRFFVLGIKNFLLIPVFVMVASFLIYLGATYLKEGNGFGVWIVLVFFVNFQMVRIGKLFR